MSRKKDILHNVCLARRAIPPIDQNWSSDKIRHFAKAIHASHVEIGTWPEALTVSAYLFFVHEYLGIRLLPPNEVCQKFPRDDEFIFFLRKYLEIR
jgi:hypothetical protein